jgi:hypothetical protein
MLPWHDTVASFLFQGSLLFIIERPYPPVKQLLGLMDAELHRLVGNKQDRDNEWRVILSGRR